MFHINKNSIFANSNETHKYTFTLKITVMEKKTLDLGAVLQDAFTIGIKNAPSVVAALLLWLVTIWIPYINIGTTIAITLLPVELAKGNVINPLAIFDSKWRRYMGEFFMTYALMIAPISIAFLFLFIPGIVLSIAWSLALYILIEKDKNPIQAIKASNDATYGSKWTIFFASLVVGILLCIIGGIFFGCCSLIDIQAVTILVMALVVMVLFSVSLSVNASIWRQLKDNVE